MEPWRKDIYHSGILGMHWGKRNGPPYPLRDSQLSGEEKRLSKRETKREVKRSKTENYIKNLTDEELDDHINRLQKENKYKELSGIQKKTDTYLKGGAKEGLKDLTKSAITKIGESYVTKILKPKEKTKKPFLSILDKRRKKEKDNYEFQKSREEAKLQTYQHIAKHPSEYSEEYVEEAIKYLRG